MPPPAYRENGIYHREPVRNMTNGKGPLALGLVMLISGIALLGWAVSEGDAELYLVLIFPVVTGTGPIFAVGALLFIFGIFVTFIGISLVSAYRMAGDMDASPDRRAPPPTDDQQPGAPQTGTPPPQGGAQFGGVVFIGPIPIVFGKGQPMGKWMLVGSIVFGILLIVFILGLFL
jgi:uncharacterized protein (TIGR00304 family)